MVDSLRTEEIDSNAEILPAKKSNKIKRMNNKVHENVEEKRNQKLSKSQKRKLKKLEEEKEKAVLLSKSMEMLEKYKLPEDAYSLLRSSKSIGRAETLLEKRRRAIQFSKSGLVLPRDDGNLERGDGDVAELDGDDLTDKSQVQPMMVEREILNAPSGSLDVSQQTVDPIELGSNGGSGMVVPAGEIPENLNDTCVRDTTAILSGHDGGEISDRMDGADESKNEDSRRNSNLSDCALERTPVAPCIVHVSRPKEINKKRKDLPIVMMEQEIMEAINDNPAVIICGETGCGKTTQVPQFLYEAGFGSKKFSSRSGIIGVTQPRRVAVLATAKRVAAELGVRLGQGVGFQVRHDRKLGENSSIKFMTDGILLREVQNDMLLRRYSVIILDEAHERSLNTDILVGMLSRVIRLRQYCYEEQRKLLHSGENINLENMIFPIKLVLMSATLRVEDFISGRRLFDKPPPVIEVAARQYPVSVHFSKRTEIVDYMGQAYKTVMSIHKKTPPGGILVFVTGQREVKLLCRQLHTASRESVARSTRRNGIGEVITNSVPKMSSADSVDIKEISEAFNENSNQQNERFNSSEGDLSEIDDDNLSEDFHESDTEMEWETVDDNTKDKENLVDASGEDGILASLSAAFESLAGKNASESNSDGKQNSLVTKEGSLMQSISYGETKREESEDNVPIVGALRVLPLYAMLPAAEQLRVFEEVKEGERLVVVATNVAETSLTIPGIKYVVDTGREKVKNYDPSTGIETYEVQWISKASAAQRAGRAGRTGPGHCYRLYSSAVFNNMFADFSCAEISKVPVDGVVLLLKSMHIDKVANFPFPTPPEKAALHEAERCLKALEALDTDGKLTSLGKAMAYYPMSPRHSRMLLTVIQNMRKVTNNDVANQVLGYAVATAAALSLQNPLIMQFEGSQSAKDQLDDDGIKKKEEKLQKKKIKEKAKEAREKFSNPSSDALTIVYALQNFELSGRPEDFCKENGLHLKTMEEMSNLRKQLLQLVFNQNSNLDGLQDFSWTHGTMEDVENSFRVAGSKSLLSKYEDLLGEAIYAGWADRVAKRIRGTSGLAEGDRKANAARYQACMVQETVFLHRWSSLATSAPEFLVYSELLRTRRPYLHGATRVKPEWLVKYAKSLCTFSSPLTDPKPYYEPHGDQVYCYVTPTFGPHLWALPLHQIPISDDVHRVAVFGYSLLEGHVLPCLRQVRKFLAAPPRTILEPQAYGQRRVGNLLKELKARKIDSCAVLRRAWDRNPKALFPEIEDWFQESFHGRFSELWLEMLREVKLDARERFPKRTRKD